MVMWTRDRTCEFRQLAESIKPDQKLLRKPKTKDEGFLLSSSIVSEASSIINRLIRLRGSLAKAVEDGIGDLPEFGACLEAIAGLQLQADKLTEMEKSRTRGWFSSADAGETQVTQHIATIIWYLSHTYSSISKEFESLKQSKGQGKEHLKKAQEKRVSALASYKPKSSPSSGPSSPVLDDKMKVDEFAQKYHLSPDQIQMLQTERQEIVQELTDMKGQVRQTERSVNEIARLQTTLQESLVYQESQIERLYDDAELTVDMVQRGNAYLSKASKNQSGFRNIMVIIILTLTFIMLFMHAYLD